MVAKIYALKVPVKYRTDNLRSQPALTFLSKLKKGIQIDFIISTLGLYSLLHCASD